MLGHPIYKEDLKYIKEVNFIKCEYTAKVCNIYVNVTMNYNLREYYLIGKVFKDWRTQGCYTYINGHRKDYKTVKPALNAILKKEWFGLEYDKILIYAGLKKDIKDTRAYKKLIKNKIATKTVDTINNIDTTIKDTNITTQFNTSNNINKIDKQDHATSTNTKDIEVINDDMIKGYKLLKNVDNVQIYGTIENYTSRIMNESYDVVSDIIIAQDKQLIYKRNNISFPVDSKEKISIVDYLDDIILYINNTTVDKYLIKKELENLLFCKKQIRFELAIRSIKRRINKDKEQAKHEQHTNEINKLKSSVIDVAIKKNLLICIGSKYIRILKGITNLNLSRSIIEDILKMNADDPILKTNLLKDIVLQQEDIYNKTKYEISKILLTKTKEYLNGI